MSIEAAVMVFINVEINNATSPNLNNQKTATRAAEFNVLTGKQQKLLMKPLKVMHDRMQQNAPAVHCRGHRSFSTILTN